MRRRLLMPVVLVLCVLPATASGAGAPQPPHCPLFTVGVRAPTEYPLGTTTLVARDPYNGVLPRTRLFFRFDVRGSEADFDRIARVEWALDGRTVRVDPTPNFTWAGVSGSGRIPAGSHTVRVTVVFAAGPAQSVEFPLTATDCRPAGFSAFPPVGADLNPPRFVWSAEAEESGTAPDLDRVDALAAAGVVTALPAGVRGRVAGQLRLFRAKAVHPFRVVALRVPRHGATLARRGALRVTLTPGLTRCCRRFLEVRGLPKGTKRVDLELTGAGRQLVRVSARARRYSVLGRLTAGSTTVRVICSATFAGRAR